MRHRLSCLLFALIAATAVAEESPVGISEVDTHDLKLYYIDSLDYLVPHVLSTFENSLAWQRRMFGWKPSELAMVLIQDRADYGNGVAYPAPHGLLLAEIEPTSHAFETLPTSERMYWLANHEMVHLMSFDISADEDIRWRRFFLGKVAPEIHDPESLLYSYLTVPRHKAPRWYLEGGAVFFETWMAGGLGRAQGGYDEMVFRAMVRDGAHFYDLVGLDSRGVQLDFQVGANAYLYGTRFFTWLAYTYGPEKVVAWYRRDEGSARYWSDRFQQVFGIPVEQAWQDWIRFEHEFQRKNLARVREFPITPSRKLVGSAMGSVSRTYYDEATGTLYGGFRYPGVVEYVGALNTRDGSVRHLANVQRSILYRVTSFAYDAATWTAYYTNNNKGDLSFRDLMSVDVRTGEIRTLIQGGRVGEIVVNPVDHSLIGVRHNNGIATLVRIPPPYDTWYRVYSFPYGIAPSDLDISPDGKLLSASVEEVGGAQFLRVWPMEKIMRGDTTPLSEFRFGQAVPESFTFSRDGRFLYGSSYYTGVSNIFRYEVATGDIEAMTNSETGFFRPVPLADGRLIVLEYTGAGFVPAIIDPKPLKDLSAISFLGTELVEKYPVVKTWQVPPPSAIDEQKLITSRGPYAPLHQVSLANAYPVLQGYKNEVGVGYRFNFEDPLKFANLSFTAAYTPAQGLPTNERGHVEVDGRYQSWRANLAWNRSDFYDLFGPFKLSRKGFAGKLGYDRGLINHDPARLDLLFDFAYYDKIDTLPWAQAIHPDFTRLGTAEATLRYTNLQRSQGSVEDESGWSGNLVAGANRAKDQVTPQAHGNVDFGVPLSLPYTSLWVRSAAGVANGDRNNVASSFYFGAFQNNYVDNKEVKRYRNYDSLPGFAIDRISALNFVREMAEVNLPQYVFESAGTPGLFLNSVRSSVFVAHLWADPGNASLHKEYTSLGVQADLQFKVLHWSEMTLSIGYAVGYQGSRRAGSEWMVSLKIM
jgi:hypothetical protein